MSKLSWKYPYCDGKEYEELCKNSKGSDFYYCVGVDLFGKTYAAINPKAYFDSWGEIWRTLIDTASFLPLDHLTLHPKHIIDEWYKANIWQSDLSPEETQALLHAYGLEQNAQFGRLVELKFFKKPLVPDMEMDFSEFTQLMEQTTENLKRMRAAQQYMRWQFGKPFYYEDFVSEMKDTMDGWVSSHC